MGGGGGGGGGGRGGGREGGREKEREGWRFWRCHTERTKSESGMLEF